MLPILFSRITAKRAPGTPGWLLYSAVRYIFLLLIKKSEMRHGRKVHACLLQVIGTIQVTPEHHECDVIKVETVVTSEHSDDTVMSSELHTSPAQEAASKTQTGDVVVRHYPQPIARFACDVCGRRYAQQRGLDRHRRERHDVTPTSSFKCRICSKVLTRRYILRRHLASVHGVVCAEKDDEALELYSTPVTIAD